MAGTGRFPWKEVGKNGMGRIYSFYDKNRRILENFLFPLFLVLYPLAGIRQGIDVSDTTYSLANFQYFVSMKGTWIIATFLSNAAGRLLMGLPFGDTLMGMYFYTALLQSVTAVMAYRVLKKKIPAYLVFLGEGIALGLCWCPSVILYNYLTYLLMTAGVLLLYEGIRQEAEECFAVNGLSGGRKMGNAHKCYLLAGVCLGINVAVRMPNVTQAAFIVAVWYGVALSGGENKGWRIWKDTLWCLSGYAAGFGIPFGVICMRYGIAAYPSMVYTMFAMTQKASDYQPSSMLTGMMGDYLTGLYWLLFAVICMADGWVLFHLQQRFLADCRYMALLCKSVYGAVFLLLLRFYWGRGMFSFRYYEYDSMYYPAVLLLTVTVLLAVPCLYKKDVPFEGRVAAVLVLVQMLVTPLGSNNALYPMINNLFVAAPFALWAGYFWITRQRTQAVLPDHTRSGTRNVVVGLPFFILVFFVLVQSVGFHLCFSFQDGIEGEKRDTVVTAPAKAQGVYTTKDNALWLSELAEYTKGAGLTGKPVLLYGEIPGLGYLLDLPPALSTYWPDLDSYLMAEYKRDLAEMAEPPVIIVASPTAAYLAEDADGMNWFGVDQAKLDADEKLQILRRYMEAQGYQETFGNGRYVVYLEAQLSDTGSLASVKEERNHD